MNLSIQPIAMGAIGAVYAFLLAKNGFAFLAKRKEKRTGSSFEYTGLAPLAIFPGFVIGFFLGKFVVVGNISKVLVMSPTVGLAAFALGYLYWAKHEGANGKEALVFGLIIGALATGLYFLAFSW